MELENPKNGSPDSPNPWNADEFESACSTPFSSAPSSPGRGGEGAAAYAAGGFFFFSAPSSPMHCVLSSPSSLSTAGSPAEPSASADFSFVFEFSARPPSSADELFLNGQIRPTKLSSPLQRPRALAPLPNLDAEADEDGEQTPGDSCDAAEAGVCRRDLHLRCRSVRRRTRFLSPMRNLPFRCRMQGTDGEERGKDPPTATHSKQFEEEVTTAPSVSASSRSSSSSSTSSSSSAGSSAWGSLKRWTFLKDLLHRSKSEGSGHTKDKFWHGISFSTSKDRPMPSVSEPENMPPSTTPSRKETAHALPPRPADGFAGRRRSAHEQHYTANRAQAEEMKRRTFLPYQQGVLGGLWLNSRSYGAVNAFARSPDPVCRR